MSEDRQKAAEFINGFLKEKHAIDLPEEEFSDKLDTWSVSRHNTDPALMDITSREFLRQT